MAGTFVKVGWRRALLQVGEGHLIGYLTIDQVYAKYQHERPDLIHPRGGSAYYLRDTFQARYALYLRKIAKAFLHGDPDEAMAEAMESFDRARIRATPVLYRNLRRSGHPRVYSRGRKVYDRPPAQHRLSREELRAQRRTGTRSRKRRLR
jgi:hypothetical protein